MGCPGYHVCRCHPPGVLSRETKKAKLAGKSRREPIKILSESDSEPFVEVDSEWTSDHERVATQYDQLVPAPAFKATGESLSAQACLTTNFSLKKSRPCRLLARAQWMASMVPSLVSELRLMG